MFLKQNRELNGRVRVWGDLQVSGLDSTLIKTGKRGEEKPVYK